MPAIASDLLVGSTRRQETAMLFYRDHIYPRLVSVLGDPEPILEVRQRIVPLAEGKVLEIGVGPGVNFAHYNPTRVSKLYALEPNPGMIRLAERQRRRTELNVEFLDLPGERIPFFRRPHGKPRITCYRSHEWVNGPRKVVAVGPRCRLTQ
jgi:hypothetical protein